MGSKINNLALTVFTVALLAITSCTKPHDDNNNNNNNQDYMYIDLTIDGISQRYGQLSSSSGNIVTSEGEELTGVWMSVVPGQWQVNIGSSFFNNDSKASGLQFGLGFDWAGGVGSASLDGTKYTGACFIRQSPGSGDPMTNQLWLESNNYTRTNSGSCVSNTATVANLEVSFTQWANHSGEITEGTFQGVLYENFRTGPSGNCSNSTAHPFSGSIHYRMQ